MNTIGRRPNFFIIGAQKCGTSSLSHYLGEHPGILMCEPKEPFYFATDFPDLRRMSEEADYLKLFENAGTETVAIGEASAGYLYSEEAARNIHKFDPDAKIIVMFRQPVDLVYSFHSQLLWGLDEDERDFSKAWKMQEERRAGNNLPKRGRAPQYVQYRAMGMLGEQVERLLGVFPRQQILFIFFEDLVRDTRKTYQEVLEFLGIPDDGKEEFPRMNSGKQHRFRWLSVLISRRPVWAQKLIDRLKAVLSPKGKSMIKSLYAARQQRDPLPDSLRQEMMADFREDIQKLSKLTGRDLNHWLQEPSKG